MTSMPETAGETGFMIKDASSQISADAAARIEFMRGEGFVLYTDVGRKIVKEVIKDPVEIIDGGEEILDLSEFEATDRSSLGLFLMTRSIIGHQLLNSMALTDSTYLDKFGISEEDMAAGENNNALLSGFGDRNFPWHFSAGVANSVVASFVNDSRMSEDTAKNITFSDWADLFEANWFSKLIHQLAFTRNGMYQSFGQLIEHYDGNGLYQYFRKTMDVYDPVFITQGHEERSGNPLIAEINPVVRKNLRKRMHVALAGSTGCPVARKVTRLDASVVSDNPHVANLIDEGVFSAKPEANGTLVRLEQKETAIDAVLQGFGNQLRSYDLTHGTPEFAPASSQNGQYRMAQIVHKYRQPLDIFYQKPDESTEAK